ncbi:MAG: M15 family metallopeptidase [Hyphomonadaceae bacterium]|nr:M15 family metallopeptidase [Hyphomonadaceae bacterium]
MSRPFSDLRSRPLPDMERVRARRTRISTIAIDTEGAAFHEPLVSAKDFGIDGRNYYAHDRNPPYWIAAPGARGELLLRRGAAERLRAVNARLAPEGLKLFVYDAWRPRAVQAFFHDVWVPQELQRRRPELSGAALKEEVGKYWAAPSASPERPAPHATGGAVDITLAWSDGAGVLFMGSLFDDASAISHAAHFEAGDDSSFSAEEARANRRILYWTMTEAGFVNHPNEWWHFSYGDQAWAAQTGAEKALYGLAATGADE